MFAFSTCLLPSNFSAIHDRRATLSIQLSMPFHYPFRRCIPAKLLHSLSAYPNLLRQTPPTSTPKRPPHATSRHIYRQSNYAQYVICFIGPLGHHPTLPLPCRLPIGIQFGRFGLIPNYTPTLCFAFTCYALHVYLHVHTSYVPLYDSYKCLHTLSVVSFTNLTRLRL